MAGLPGTGLSWYVTEQFAKVPAMKGVSELLPDSCS